MKILKPGNRSTIAFSVMFGILILLPISLAFQGKWLPAIQIGALFLLLYGILCVYVRRSRIIVTDHSISYRSAFGFEQKIPFQDIAFSLTSILVEPNHPVALEIYCNNNQHPCLTI